MQKIIDRVLIAIEIVIVIMLVYSVTVNYSERAIAAPEITADTQTMYSVRKVAFDSNKNIYVSDYYTCSIQIFDKSGKHLLTLMMNDDFDFKIENDVISIVERPLNSGKNNENLHRYYYNCGKITPKTNFLFEKITMNDYDKFVKDNGYENKTEFSRHFGSVSVGKISISKKLFPIPFQIVKFFLYAFAGLILINRLIMRITERFKKPEISDENEAEALPEREPPTDAEAPDGEAENGENEPQEQPKTEE